MGKVRGFLDLTRILPNQIMLGTGVLIGEIISVHGPPPARLAILGFSGPFLLGTSTFAMNDYFDLEADRAGGREDRPLVRGDISPRTAMGVFLVGFPLGLVLSSAINWRCLLTAVVFASLAILYNLRMKETGLPGNLFIAATMGIPFIFGSFAVGGGLSIPIVVLSLIAFLAGCGREVLKDIMDVKGDELRRSRSVARTWGIERAARLSSGFLLVAVALSPIPFLIEESGSYYMNPGYMIPALVTDAILVWTVRRALAISEPDDAVILRRSSLFALLIGLVAFLLGAFSVT